MDYNNKDFTNTLSLIFDFTDEESDALHGFIPMTQEIFDACIEKCMRLGSRAEKTFLSLIFDYPDFLKKCPLAVFPDSDFQVSAEHMQDTP